MNKTRKVALRKHRMKARKEEAKRQAAHMMAPVTPPAPARSRPATPPGRPATPGTESGS